MSYLVFDVGGTSIKYACMEDDAAILEQGKIATPYGSLQAFVEVLSQIRSSYPDIRDVALSLPGTIDVETGYVYQGGSLTYNTQVNLKEILSTALQAHVELENDARCASLAEQWLGNMQDVENGIVLTFGTGVGGSVILHHELYKGSHLFSGEVSMLLMKDIRQVGLQGVWGSISSVPALMQQICEARQVELQDGPVVMSWVTQGEETACRIFQEYCYQIVTQLFNLQIILDPTRVCIGGGISEHPLFVETIRQTMNAFYDRLPVPLPRLEIMPCRFHNDSNLIGALYHYKKRKEISHE